MSDLEERRLKREISAREQAEELLEKKSRELYYKIQENEQNIIALKESEELHRIIVEFSPNSILIVSEGKIVYANNGARNHYRETETNTLIGKTLISLSLPEDQHIIQARLDSIEETSSLGEIEETAVRLDGTTFFIDVRRHPMQYNGKAAILSVARDISFRRELQQQLSYEATHDALTQISNRAHIMQCLDQALHHAARYSYPIWAGFIDLDEFKPINDFYGHAIGDKVLIEVVNRIKSVLRASDMVGRYGGDEFIIILKGGPGEEQTSSLTEELATRILKAVNQPLIVNAFTLNISCSLGIALAPTDQIDAETFVDRADTAMYEAKAKGKNKYCFYGE
jgi:diguanylate cyclase (GGDEF)-like protein/PAS domain S-box-containing protein